jgi:hypothetical protein
MILNKEVKIKGWVHSHFETHKAIGFQCFSVSFEDEYTRFEDAEFVFENCKSSDENDYLWELIEDQDLPIECEIELVLNHFSDSNDGEEYLELIKINK